jgi:WD40 repeat protein
VWDAVTGQPLIPPLKHSRYVRHAAFSPDGRLVLTASADGTARVWDAATGEPVTPPLRHRGPVSDAVFSPDGRRMLTASDDGTARIWELPRDAQAVRDCVLLAELMTCERLDPAGGLVPLEPAAFRKAWQTLRSKHSGSRVSSSASASSRR